MVILQKNKKKLCKGIFDALLANQIWITYGDFEKYLKIYEFAMKNGNFIIFFFGKFRQKRVLLWWARWFDKVWLEGQIFPEYAFFFAQGICTFFVSCLEKNWENAPFFGCLFFWFCKGIFQKTAKKNFSAFYG